MTSPWRCSFRFFLFLLVLALFWSPVAQAVEVNKPAPPFSVQDLNGNTYDLNEVRGTVVLLFFFSPNDPFCVTDAPKLQDDIWSEFSWHNFKILGINVGPQEVEEVTAFRKATGVDFPLIPAGGEMGGDYQVEENTFIVVDGEGIIRYVSGGTGARAYNEDEIRSAVSGALENVLPPKEATWGRIKTLFEEKRF